MNEITLLTLDTAVPDTTLLSALIAGAIILSGIVALIATPTAFEADQHYTRKVEWFTHRNPKGTPLPDDILRHKRRRNIALVAVIVGLTVTISASLADEPARAGATARAAAAINEPLTQQADEIADARSQFYVTHNIDEARLCSTASLAHPLHDTHVIVRPDTLIQCGGADFGYIIYTLPESMSQVTVTSTYATHSVQRNAPLHVYLKVTPGDVS